MNRRQLLLIKLAEECNEVAQIALKTAQFGMDNCCPEQLLTNRQKIHVELDDIMASIHMLNEEFDLGYTQNSNNVLDKIDRVNDYAAYSERLGMVNGLKPHLDSMCNLWLCTCNIRGYDPHHMIQYTKAKKALAEV